MKTLEILRHTMRRKPGEHLSKEGINLARLIARQLPPFDIVVTSAIPRAIETAIAMGFEINQTIEKLGSLPKDIFAKTRWPSDISAISKCVIEDIEAAHFAAEQAYIWLSIVRALPVDGRGLIITHGAIIELAAVSACPDANYETWGGPFGYCEGVRLQYSDKLEIFHIEMLRVPDTMRLIEN